MNNEATGTLIRTLRKEKKLTQKELAQRLNVTDRAVSKWERGLCTPDIALLEPLAQALDVTVLELISGARAQAEPHPENIDSAVKEVLRYSEQELAQKKKTMRKRSLLAVVCVCLALLLALPVLNGTVGGDGFAWRCIPAWLCARSAARALENYDKEGIERCIGNAGGVYEALEELREQDVLIRDARASFSRTRLDDMFLFTELELTVWQGQLTYLLTCRGTWRNGKVELMEICAPDAQYDGPAWLPQLSEALSTYDPG